MEAIILAGGLGTRLRSIISDIPKCMAPIQGRPFLELLLSVLGANGFSRVILSVGYLGEKIKAYFGEAFLGIELVYSDESSPLGTGGGLKKAMSLVSQDHVYVLNGDTYLEFNMQETERLWKKYQNPIFIVKKVHEASRYGALELFEGRVKGFSEKSLSREQFINAGCYVFSRGVFEDFDGEEVFSLERDFLPQLIEKNLVRILECKEFIDIGVPLDYERANKELASKF